MPSAADGIVAAIAAKGRVRFDDYLDLALNGPNGFYTTSGSAGRRGDFITSPEVGPLFGAVLARYVEAEYLRLGCPAEFEVVEVGAGPGTLARSMVSAWRNLPAAEAMPELAYTAVELSETQRARHPAGSESMPELPTRDIVGVVVCNELLDNVPFRLLVFDGIWREAFVVAEGDRLFEELVEVNHPPTWLPAKAPHGARVPWQQRALGVVEAMRAIVAEGSLLVFDYVSPSTAELAARPWREWLRTYRGHERGTHYLADPGCQDITNEVALDQLPEPDTLRSQAQFLQRWGIDELVEQGRAAWTAAAGRPDVAALVMRSRVREAEALLDPAGLGAFMAMTWEPSSRMK